MYCDGLNVVLEALPPIKFYELLNFVLVLKGLWKSVSY